MAGGIASAAVLLMAAPVPLAAADTIGTARASVAVLQAEVAGQASQIHQLTTGYEQAELQVTTLQQQIVSNRASLGALRARLRTSQRTLRQAALRSYVDGQGTTASLAGGRDPSVRYEYLSVVSGDIGNTVDQLGLQQRQLRSAEEVIAAEQRASAAAVSSAASARAAALGVAGEEQVRLVSLQSHLDSLVAAQSVAGARSAAALRAQVTATQGTPVNNGLVSAVRSILVTPATSGVAAPAPTTVVAPPPTTTPSTPAPTPTVPPPTPAPTTTVSPPTAGSPSGGASAQSFAELRQCESGGNYQENTGNGYYGAYQFSASTWTDMGFPGRPDQEPPAMQDQAAAQLQSSRGWSQWPTCASALGLS